MRKDTQGVNIYLGLKEEEVALLKESAKNDCRSMAQYVTFIVRKYLKDQESKNKND